MAVCKQTPQEFIQDVFSPMVAVICSEDAENMCKKNNLTFVELVQPFCRINTEVTIRDPSSVSFIIRSLHVIIKDIKYQPPSPAIAKKMMNDAVLNCHAVATDGLLCNKFSNGNYSLQYISSAPWFEAYREVFFQVTYPTEHEFIHHYLACIFVVSSSQVDPLNQINELHQQQEKYQQQSSSHNAHWFFSAVLKYYVLLHDVSEENLSKAETIYQSMKSTYGAGSCHLLQINSKSQGNNTNSSEQDESNEIINLPDPWSQFLPKAVEQSLQNENETIRIFPEENTFPFPEHIYEGNQEQIDGIAEINPDIQHPLSLNTEQESPTSDSVVSSPLEEETNLSKVYGQNGGRKIKENKCHGIYLTLSDRERIRVFMQDFCVQGLIPFVEKQIRILNDQVANRKGLHRSLFSATKKWFSGNKPGVQGPASSTTSVIYSQDAPELQVRRLGDLAFMFQLYDLAYQAYHNAKRDFSNDQAWLHYAGATEMAALSVFMQGASSQRQYPNHYMDSAITTYLNTCKSSILATRATLLSTECLKNKGMYSEAALQFIRMTSEDSDLRSALLLEQAAHCFINAKPFMIRKYAFHIILAGHRYSKAGQRKHALRAYKLAEQVYKEKNWRLAEDHINFIIGRQSLNLKQLEDACLAFQGLLTKHSLQSAAQQAIFIREYLFVLKLFKQSLHNNQELPILPLPTIESQNTKVLLGQVDKNIEENCLLEQGKDFDQADKNSSTWIHLAKLVLSAAQGSVFITHHPQLQCLTENTDNSVRPLSVVGEIIIVELHIKNPLSVPLILSNIFLLWRFIPKENGKEGNMITNEMSLSKTDVLGPITKVLPEVNLEGQERKKIHLFIQPTMMGDLHITGAAFTLQTLPSSNQNSMNGEISSIDTSNPKILSISNVAVQGKQNIELIGRRLNNTKAEKIGKVYGPDYRLKPIIIQHMPKLQVKFHSFPSLLFCGEVRQINVEFKNIGQCVLHRILVASPNPESFMFGTPGYELDNWMVYKETTCDDKNSLPIMAECPNIEQVCEIMSSDGTSCQLNCGETLTIPMWIRGPDTAGNHTIDFLFYYEVNEQQAKMRYRLLQHSTSITTLPSLRLKCEASRSSSFSENYLSHCTSSANSFVLSLEAENISEDQGTEISILQVSCVSRDWCLYSLTDIQGHGAISIRPQEALLLAMKVVPFNPRNTVSSQSAVVFSQVPLGRTEVDSSATPCCDFSWRSQLRPQNQNISVHKPLEAEMQNDTLNMIKILQTIALTLTVLWKAKVERDNQIQVVVGQQHISLEKVDSSIITLPATKSFEQKPPIHIIPDPEDKDTLEGNDLTDQAVRFTINHPFHVQHNFSETRLVQVPVILVAHNCCQSDLYVTVDMREEIKSVRRSPISTPSSPQELYQGLSSQGFSWIGPSQRHLFLKAGSTAHLPLQACFSSAGAYSMGNLRVASGLSKSSVMVLQQPMPSLIIVSNDK